MYQLLRDQAKEKAKIQPMDYSSFFTGKTALEVLRITVYGYIKMNHQERMILATKQLFYAMEVHSVC